MSVVEEKYNNFSVVGEMGGGDYKEKDRRLKKKEQGGLDRANER